MMVKYMVLFPFPYWITFMSIQHSVNAQYQSHMQCKIYVVELVELATSVNAQTIIFSVLIICLHFKSPYGIVNCDLHAKT